MHTPTITHTNLTSTNTKPITKSLVSSKSPRRSSGGGEALRFAVAGSPQTPYYDTNYNQQPSFVCIIEGYFYCPELRRGGEGSAQLALLA